MTTSHQTYAVLGSHFGQEGKGVVIAALCEQILSTQTPCMVWKHVGSSHSKKGVVDHKNKRVVMQSLGAGSLSRCPTHFGQDWAHNPFDLATEVYFFNKKHKLPLMSADPKSMIITPWDRALEQAQILQQNQIVPHIDGSGTRSTWMRKSSQHTLNLADLFQPRNTMIEKLRSVQKEGFREQCEHHRIDEKNDVWAYAQSEDVLWNFVEAITAFKRFVTPTKDEDVQWDGDIVFEGQAGLLRDPFHNAEHTLPYHTGTKGLEHPCLLMGRQDVNVLWTTRPYITCQGPQNLDFETPEPLGLKHHDWVNTTTPWEGPIRHARLDVEKTHNTIIEDTKNSKLDITNFWALTCTDQLETAGVVQNHKTHHISMNTLADSLETFQDVAVITHGCTTKHVTFVEGNAKDALETQSKQNRQ